MSQQEIVQGGPKTDSLLKRLAKTGLTALGITAATAPGIAALNQAAQNASSEHSTPVSPQEDPFKQQPPQGVAFPEGIRADAPVPDAPVEPVLSHKLFLPNVTNKAVETLTPEQRVERFIATTQVVDRVEQVRNNKIYVIESRVTPQAAHQVVVKEELKDQVAQLVAKDGERNGFTKARIAVLNSASEIPEGVNVGLAYTILGENRGRQEIFIGSLGGQRVGDQLILFFAPAPNLPLSDPEILDRANMAIANNFTRLIYSGGNPNYIRVSLVGQTEHAKLIDQRALNLSYR